MKDSTETTTRMSVVPYLTCRNASEAYEFYQKAFGAAPMCKMDMPDGRVIHGALDFGGAPVYVSDEFPEHGGTSPRTLGGTAVTIHLQVHDCDVAFNRAVEAGCTVEMPLDEMFWGDRYGVVADPYGHKWSIATTIRTVNPEEMKKAVAAF